MGDLTIILGVLIPFFGFLIALYYLDSRPQGKRVTKLEAGQRTLETEIVGLRTDLANVHLTPEDRELLALPSTEVLLQKAINTVVEAKVAGLVAARTIKKHPSEVEDCGDHYHEWSRKYWDIPARVYNQKLFGDVDDENRAYLRKCMDCDMQQVQQPGNGIWHDD